MAILKRENILHTFPKIKELVGRSIFVSAIVQTENGKFYYFFFLLRLCEQFKYSIKM